METSYQGPNSIKQRPHPLHARRFGKWKHPTKAQTPPNSDIIPCIQGDLISTLHIQGPNSIKQRPHSLHSRRFGKWKHPTKAQTPPNNDLIPCIRGDWIRTLHIQLHPLSSNRKTKMQSSSTSHLVYI